jgi:malate/lactate dehydrogenase
MKRVSIVGRGNVGTNTAFFIAENRTADVMLVDLKEVSPPANRWT